MLGSVIGVCGRWTTKCCGWAGAAYVEIFRNIPLLAQMFLWYFVISRIAPGGRAALRQARDAGPAILDRGGGARTLYGVARCRTGALRHSVDPARAKRGRRWRWDSPRRRSIATCYCRLATATVIPSLTNDFLGVFKNSSLALTIGVMELTAAARQIDEYTFQSFEAYAAATVLYSCVTLCVIVLMRFLEHRTRIAGTASAGGR